MGKRLFLLVVLLSSMSAIALADTTYFPQIADGGGYSTTFTIVNVASTPVAGTLRLYNQDGTSKFLQINGVSASQFSVTVPAGGTVRLTTPNASAVIGSGWAAFDSTPRLQGVATFDYRVGGALVATAGVIGTTPVTRAIVPIDLTGTTASTGIALANVQNAALTVRLRLYAESGTEVATILDTRLNPLGAQKQVADFITSFFGTLGGSFRGSLAVEVVGIGAIAVTGLTVKEGLLSAVPAVEAPSATTPPAVSAPTLTSMTPSSGNAGSALSVTIAGNNFVSGATTVQITGTGVSIGSPQVTSSTSLNVTFTIAATATTDVRTVSVTTAGGTSNGLTFSVLPTAPTTPPVVSFGPGKYLVGKDIAAGRYYAVPGSSCYWERLSGLGGTLGEIIANDFISGYRQAIVDIAASDLAFSTDSGCGTWSNTPRVGSQSTISAGTWVIGTQVTPGTYQANASSGCYWERLRNFSGTLSAIIANNFISSTGNQLVSIAPSDVGFTTTSSCGQWARISDLTNSKDPASADIASKQSPAELERNWRMSRSRMVP